MAVMLGKRPLPLHGHVEDSMTVAPILVSVNN